MSFQNTHNNTGVSAMIGVIILIAITVSMVSLIAGFVLDLPDRYFSENINASVSIDQYVADIEEETYYADLRITSIENADYVIIRTNSEENSNVSYTVDRIDDTVDVEDDSSLPDETTDIVDVNDQVLSNVGDEVIIGNEDGLQPDDRIQIFAGSDNDVILVNSYTVQDQLP